MIVHELAADADEVATATGWVIKPEGACKGELCVPLPDDVHLPDDRIDLTVLADRLGMAIVHDADLGLWSVGPESLGGHVLTTAEAPPLILPDVDGVEFDLASLRGQKVLVVAWAPY